MSTSAVIPYANVWLTPLLHTKCLLTCHYTGACITDDAVLCCLVRAYVVVFMHMLSLCDYLQLCAPNGTRNHAMFARSGYQAHCDTGSITIHTLQQSCSHNVVQVPLNCKASVCMLAIASTDWVLLGVQTMHSDKCPPCRLYKQCLHQCNCLCICKQPLQLTRPQQKQSHHDELVCCKASPVFLKSDLRTRKSHPGQVLMHSVRQRQLNYKLTSSRGCNG